VETRLRAAPAPGHARGHSTARQRAGGKKKGWRNAFCLGFWATAPRVQIDPPTAGWRRQSGGLWAFQTRSLGRFTAAALVLGAAGGWGCWEALGGKKCAGIYTTNASQQANGESSWRGARREPGDVPPRRLPVRRAAVGCRRCGAAGWPPQGPVPSASPTCHPQSPPPAVRQSRHWCTRTPRGTRYRAVWWRQNQGWHRMSAAQVKQAKHQPPPVPADAVGGTSSKENTFFRDWDVLEAQFWLHVIWGKKKPQLLKHFRTPKSCVLASPGQHRWGFAGVPWCFQREVRCPEGREEQRAATGLGTVQLRAVGWAPSPAAAAPEPGAGAVGRGGLRAGWGLYMPGRGGHAWGSGGHRALRSGTVRSSVVPRAQSKVLGSAAGHGAGERLPARPALCRMWWLGGRAAPDELAVPLCARPGVCPCQAIKWGPRCTPKHEPAHSNKKQQLPR